MKNIFNIFKSKPKPEINTGVFKTLYSYQMDAVKTTFTNPRGIICMPTGVGKTFCQASIIADDIMKNRNEFRIYVVNAPRIMLSYQLLKEVFGFLVRNNIEARYMFVHSGDKMDERELAKVKRDSKGDSIPYSKVGSGTSPIAIKDMIEKAKKDKLPLIFFSTYNSAERIEEARLNFTKQEISIVLNDEAHYLVQEQFHPILKNLPSPRCYFFTATMINTSSDKGRGMNHVEDYGDILYTMTPREAIKIGKMVRPRVHYVTTEGTYTPDDYDKNLNKIIADTFKQHEKVLCETKQLPKILISTKGTENMIYFLSSQEYRDLRNEGVDIYMVACAEDIKNCINDERVSRPEFLKRLKIDGENKTKRLIVLHYDILAEGIDVSGFTGIMPLRTLNKSKFMQTFGRSARPDNEDRPKLEVIVQEKGFVSDDDWKTMNKPYAYVIIPTIIQDNEDDKENLMQLIKELRSEYGYNPSEYIVSDSRIAGQPKDEITDEGNVRVPHIGKTIDEINYEVEDEVNAQLSKDDLFKKLFKE